MRSNEINPLLRIDGRGYRVEEDGVVTAQGRRVVDGVEEYFEFSYNATYAVPLNDDEPKESPPHEATGGVKNTSRDAYAKHAAIGKLGRQHEIILAVLRGQARDMTRQELARKTGLGINAVCGRVNELMAEPFRLVEVHRRRRCEVTSESVEALRVRSGA